MHCLFVELSEYNDSLHRRDVPSRGGGHHSSHQQISNTSHRVVVYDDSCISVHSNRNVNVSSRVTNSQYNTTDEITRKVKPAARRWKQKMQI